MNYYTDVLKKYAVFSGRARRKEYWMFALWNFIACFVIVTMVGLMAAIVLVTKNPALSGLFLLVPLYSLGVFVPNLAVAVRRLHDTNHSAWWLLIAVIPVIGAIVLLIFMVLDSQPGDNKYGPNPKGIAAPTVSQSPVQQ
jgi:uncharacterized membrane protein YhaH (DUF805 family)